MKTGFSGRVSIRTGSVLLDGVLEIPCDRAGLALVAQGGVGSSGRERNSELATTLAQAGLATLVCDLLTADEAELDERSGQLRHETEFLGNRLAGAVRWVKHHAHTSQLPIACVGFGSDAAVVLDAAARQPRLVSAVVAIGGRPDDALQTLRHVNAATLLIAAAEDLPGVDSACAALAALDSEKRLLTLPGSRPLFNEPAAFEQLSQHVLDWLIAWLAPETAPVGE